MKEVKRTRSVSSREAAQTAHGARRRKRKKRSYTLYYLLLLFFVLVSGITLSLTVFFNIETITVTGSELHKPETVIQHSGIEKGNNLFRINLEKAKKKLIDAFGDIDDVKITKKFPSSLIIELTDAVEAYCIRDELGYTVISVGGRILAQGLPQEQLGGGIPVKGIDAIEMKLGSYIDKEQNEKFALLDQLDTAIKTSMLTDITYIDLENNVELSLCYQDRLIIELGSPSELTYKLNFARHVIEKELTESDTGVIDTTQAGKTHFVPGDIHSDLFSDVTSDVTSGESSDNSAVDENSTNSSSSESSSTTE